LRRYSRVAALVLAAGGSRRLGQPKQLVSMDNRPLVRQTVERAFASGCGDVFVVVGAHSGAVRAALAGLDVVVVDNPRWETGMGSSIRSGVDALQKHPLGATGVLIVSVDQYRIPREHLQRLREAHDAGHGLVASSYAGTLGIPALFSRPYFTELLRVDPAQGGKDILAKRRDRVFPVTCVEGRFDLDTQYDLEVFNRRTSV